MKRITVVMVIASLVVGGSFAFEGSNRCAEWQERYSAMIAKEMMKPGPALTEEVIEQKIGPRPERCAALNRLAG